MAETSGATSSVRLPDGRTVGLIEYGVPDGQALLYFHGYPGSRLEAGLLADAAARLGVRLIGIDRPGMGLSTFKPARRLVDWPDDVAALGDHLGIDRFSVFGFSGGAPYAIACAYKIPDRLTGCGIVAGPGPVGGWRFLLSRLLPRLATPFVRRLFKDRKRATQSLRRLARRWPDADRKSLALTGVSETLASSLTECFRQGSKGPAREGTLLGGGWGFELQEVRYDHLCLWHGERDAEIPIATARGVAGRLRRCTATYFPDDGHISLIVNHSDEIVQTLVRRRQTGA
jgi:pimeloyl-ACP methyl ester carboxylesterase